MRSIHDPRYQDLIKKLIELRESKNVTQVELAQHLGKPQSYVSKVEILENGEMFLVLASGGKSMYQVTEFFVFNLVALFRT